MTKLIAALAILAALAWGVTAAAQWIAKKKAPLALAAGKTPLHATAADQDRAMSRAQWRTVAALVFAAVMFAALFRISIGLSGDEGLPIAVTTGLSASGGLLLYSVLPAAKLATSERLLPKRAFVLPAATLAGFFTFIVFIVATTLVPALTLEKYDGVPLLLVAVLLCGAASLALHRLNTTAALPDPRMAALDRRLRGASATNLLAFTSAALLSFFGMAALVTALELNKAASQAINDSAPAHWAIACGVGGAALALAGVVLLIVAAKGALTLRITVRNETPAAAPV
ncbi:hypothetical protein [Arthrobacter sp. N199823]|uniref:hypothetical protein n=1 Tax=Arthrobacter sp. N199823 TaxID=2058895 RepID=UPI000CE2DDFE|nr:hypothetical protein [Arthrobacter sp. N199823]